MATTTTVSGSSLSRTLRAIRIPPVYIFLIVIFVIGGTLDQIFSDGQIFTNPNIILTLLWSVALGIVAVGQTLVIVGASIDLSVAYLISVTAVMSSYIMQGDPARVPLAMLVVFSIGALVGLINGLVITKLHVNPFIATLGMSLILAGAINASFSNYTGSVPKSFQFFGYAKLFNLIPFYLALLIIVIAGWLC
jgi:ribose transport system permease protein